jgi:hypothetical protein
MLIARIYLVLMAAMSIVFGVIYLVKPELMTDPMGFGQLAPTALTDVRATYGGFQLGMGIFLLWCLEASRIRTGLLLTLLTIAGVAGCRALGLFVIDRDISPVLHSTIILETTLTVISLVLFLRAPVVPARV